jgi:glutamine cyclotransferase
MQNFFTRGNCLNGIAYNSQTDQYNPINHRMYITGKKWPFVYEIKLKDVK